jgi:DNA repair protein RecO (recombination protein O)
MAGRSYTTEVVVLRSFRFGEADRVLHLLSRERGRVGAVGKGVRRTRSRFGGRLEPLSRVEVVLHEGRGELATITAAATVDSGDAVRSDPYRLAVGLVGIEAVVRLFPEQQPNARLYDGLVRFLATVAHAPTPAPAIPAEDPLSLGFGLKLLALAGWAPRLDACASCGAAGPLVSYSPAAGGALCPSCEGGFALAPGTLEAADALLRRPLGEAVTVAPAARRQVVRLLAQSYVEHGGTRLRTLA